MAGSAEAATTRSFYATLDGWPDNSPPGDGTAFGSGHAGGSGTYSDPVTFATDQNELSPGTKVYYPYLHRYFIMQDECVECDQDWANGKYHIDLWIGGKGGTVTDVINCEDNLIPRTPPRSSRDGGLTDRERDVLAMIVEGASNAPIARAGPVSRRCRTTCPGCWTSCRWPTAPRLLCGPATAASDRPEGNRSRRPAHQPPRPGYRWGLGDGWCRR